MTKTKKEAGTALVRVGDEKPNITLTKELRELHEAIGQLLNEFNKSGGKLISTLMDAQQRLLFRAYGKDNMVSYLYEEWKVAPRWAQTLATTARVFVEMEFKPRLALELGESMSAELAAYIFRARLDRQAADAVVDEIKGNKWTVRQFQVWAQQQLSNREIAVAGKGKDPKKEPRSRKSLDASASQWKAIQEFNKAMASKTGTDDLATNIEYALSDTVAGLSNNPEDALTAADKYIGECAGKVAQVIESALTLSEGKAAQKRTADRLLNGVLDVTLRGVISLGKNISPDAQVDEGVLAKALSTGRSRRAIDDWSNSAANVVMLLCDAFGVERKLATQVVSAIRPAEVIDAE